MRQMAGTFVLAGAAPYRRRGPQYRLALRKSLIATVYSLPWVSMTSARDRLRSRAGQSLSEYVLLLALMATGLLVILLGFGSNVGTIYTKTSNAMASVASGNTGGGGGTPSGTVGAGVGGGTTVGGGGGSAPGGGGSPGGGGGANPGGGGGGGSEADPVISPPK